MEGSLEDIDKKVEYAFLTDTFKKVCPFFLSIGVNYTDFWEGDLEIPKTYLEAYKLKIKREQEIEEWRMWKQGMYIYEALCDVSPILHAFSKKGTKPLPYPTKPYGIDGIEEKNEIEEKQKVENERLKAIVFFNDWEKAQKKHFKKKAGGDLDGDNNR